MKSVNSTIDACFYKILLWKNITLTEKNCIIDQFSTVLQRQLIKINSDNEKNKVS